MALFGAIEPLHVTEQNRTHPSSNIKKLLRDRHLKVKEQCVCECPCHNTLLQGNIVAMAEAFQTMYQQQRLGKTRHDSPDQWLAYDTRNISPTYSVKQRTRYVRWKPNPHYSIAQRLRHVWLYVVTILPGSRKQIKGYENGKKTIEWGPTGRENVVNNNINVAPGLIRYSRSLESGKKSNA